MNESNKLAWWFCSFCLFYWCYPTHFSCSRYRCCSCHCCCSVCCFASATAASAVVAAPRILLLLLLWQIQQQLQPGNHWLSCGCRWSSLCCHCGCLCGLMCLFATTLLGDVMQRRQNGKGDGKGVLMCKRVRMTEVTVKLKKSMIMKRQGAQFLFWWHWGRGCLRVARNACSIDYIEDALTSKKIAALSGQSLSKLTWW